MNIHERHQMELTLRIALRQSLDLFQSEGKPFEFMREFVIQFMDAEEKKLSDFHNQVMGKLPQKNIYRRSQIKKQYDHLIKAMNTVEDAMMNEIDLREEKYVSKKI